MRTSDLTRSQTYFEAIYDVISLLCKLNQTTMEPVCMVPVVTKQQKLPDNVQLEITSLLFCSDPSFGHVQSSSGTHLL